MLGCIYKVQLFLSRKCRTRSSDAQEKTNDDLRKAIVKHPYTWESADFKGKSIKFDANGTGRETDFQFKWRVINPQEIEIVAVDAPSGKEKAKLKFNADYTSYVGLDFDGVRQLTGHQVIPNL